MGIHYISLLSMHVTIHKFNRYGLISNISNWVGVVYNRLESEENIKKKRIGRTGSPKPQM
jgi:hypothetical protein